MLIGCVEISYAGKRGKGTPGEGKGLGKSMERGMFHVLRYGKVGSVSEQASIIRSLSRYGNYRNQNWRMSVAFGSSHPNLIPRKQKIRLALKELKTGVLRSLYSFLKTL